MAEDRNPKENPRDKELRELSQAGSEFVGILNEMKSAFKVVMKDVGMTVAEFEKIKNSQKESTNLAKVLASFTKEDLKDAKKRERFNKIVNSAKAEQKRLEAEINAILDAQKNNGKEMSDADKAALSMKQEQLDVSRQLTAESQKLTKEIKNLEGSTKFFKMMSDFTKDIPLLNKILPEFENANKAAVDKYAETGSGFQAFFAGAGSLLSILAKAFVGLLVGGLLRLDERIISVSKNLNVSQEAAGKFDTKLRSAVQGRNIDIDKVNASLTDLGQNLGFAGIASTDTGIQLDKLQGKLGLSAEQSANLFRATAGIDGNFAKTTNAIIGQTMMQNVLTKSNIRYQDVLSDIAGASENILLTQRKFPGGIAQAAFQARRFGLELSSVAAAGENLLDFQSSIEKEMEAELLLGRDLNLDRARAAALVGNQAELAEEIAKNVGTAAEFTDMNVIQQKALADAVGMSVSELAKSLTQREALLALERESGVEGLARMETEEAVQALKDKGYSREQALEKLGKDEMLRQEANITAQDKMALAIKQMSDSAADMAVSISGLSNPMSKITNLIDKISQHSTAIMTTMGIVAGATVGVKLFKLFKGIAGFVGKLPGALSKAASAAKGFFGKSGGGLVKSATSPTGFRNAAGQFAKAPGKAAGKGLGKSLLKKIPGVGLLAGLGFGISRAMQGDFVGALGEIGSGAASLIPGVGTALSMAIDGGLIARDMGAFGDSPGSRATVSDFVLKPLDKDTITMAGGTKLGGNVEALLEELLSVVRQGGDVFLDGSKVGETLIMNSRLTA